MGTSCGTPVVRGVGILVDEELRGQVVEVKKVSDRVMTIKLIVGGSSLNICSAYAPKAGLDEEEKKRFWEVLDEVGDVDSTWDRAAGCIKESTREVLGVSRGWSSKYQGVWWWNEDVKKKMETKKAAYVKLVESKDEEEKRVSREEYKLAKKEAKLAVIAAKTATFEILIEESQQGVSDKLEV
ncbi:uncharacterized protein LOC107849047 [Capsicum annuum]|uniref:uncharacterized protein LOC107849047 n=1 Tax=Capsicum annuum TaxID=4072 RepID=UPI001FB0DD7B|nr:uncharacterized protein LOC107849047 [Capsicum annuum]